MRAIAQARGKVEGLDHLGVSAHTKRMRIVPVSLDTHRDLRWSPFTDFGFARKTALAPVVLAELPRAIMSMPVGFVRTNGVAQPAALLGLRPEENLLVAPDGRWLGPYVPAAFRGHPFRLLPLEADSRMALCVDEDSGLVGRDEREAFFGPDDRLAERARQVLEFLTQVEANRQATIAATAALDSAGVLAPWPIEVRAERNARRVDGLLRVDEAALNRLDGATLAALRDAGALALAYMTLLSAQHLALLGELARRRGADEARLRSVFDKSFQSGELGDDIAFDWNAISLDRTPQ